MWELLKGNWPLFAILLLPVVVEAFHIRWLYKERKRRKEIQQETGTDGISNAAQKLFQLN